MATNPMSLAQFGQLIKSKHPEYQDLGDEDLGNRVLAKFPQYKDMVSSTLPSPSATGLANQALAGTGITVSGPSNPSAQVQMEIPGAVKRAMVAAGATLPSGVKQQPILGQGRSPLQVMSEQPLPFGTPSGAYEAIAEPARRMGEGDVAGGIGQVGAEIGKAYLLKKVAESVPSQSATSAGAELLKDSASQRFRQVQNAAQNSPVAVTNELSNSLSRYQELVDAGGSRSLAVSKLLKRVTDPTAGPLSYTEARDFYSNLTRLSADEYQRLTPTMQRQVAEVTRELGKSIQQTTASVGEGETYSDAMRIRRQASSYEGRQQQATELAQKLMKYGIGSAMAGYIAHEVLNYQKK